MTKYEERREKSWEQLEAELKAPFPPEATSWRIGQTNSGMGSVLCYIDARDVMDRLDDVVGSENWSCRYSHADMAITICELAIKISGEWVIKSDGAGDSKIEPEKGSLSDAFKRAAVRWGIGRYLYSVKAPWISLDMSDPKRPKIPNHEYERLMSYLPGYSGVTVSPLTGQAKTVGKFWERKSYNILDKLSKEMKDQHGDPQWGDPDTVVWLCEAMPGFIRKAPDRAALAKLQTDNLFWIGEHLAVADKEVIAEAFRIRNLQFGD